MKHLSVIIAAVAFLLGGSFSPLSAKNKKEKAVPEQKVPLGVWEDVDKTATVADIVAWMKPFDEAGIKHYYMAGKPEVVARYIEAAKSYPGAKIHAWIHTVNVPGDSVAMSHPEWFEVNRVGYNSYEYDPYVKHYKWLSPSVPEARAHMKAVAASYAVLDGLASVHLDFIRYNDVVLGRNLQKNKFKKQFGYSPLDLRAPWMSPEWLQFRLNEVTSLVNEIADEVHAQGKQLSAAVFPYPTRARMTVYQDWPTWHVDIVCPMNYQSFYSEGIDWIKFSVENGLRETFHKNMYVSGLFVPDITADELYKAAKLSIEAGADGVCQPFEGRDLLGSVPDHIGDGVLDALAVLRSERQRGVVGDLIADVVCGALGVPPADEYVGVGVGRVQGDGERDVLRLALYDGLPEGIDECDVVAVRAPELRRESQVPHDGDLLPGAVDGPILVLPAHEVHPILLWDLRCDRVRGALDVDLRFGDSVDRVRHIELGAVAEDGSERGPLEEHHLVADAEHIAVDVRPSVEPLGVGVVEAEGHLVGESFGGGVHPDPLVPVHVCYR